MAANTDTVLAREAQSSESTAVQHHCVGQPGERPNDSEFWGKMIQGMKAANTKLKQENQVLQQAIILMAKRRGEMIQHRQQGAFQPNQQGTFQSRSTQEPDIDWEPCD